MPFLHTPGGARIHYRCLGEEGPWVVMLQGLALSGRFWFTVPERLSQDAAKPRRVLVLDNRGTGFSPCPRRPFRMADMADDTAAVMRSVGIPSAVVVGISMGGMIAQHLALRHPALVDGLILMATSPGLPHGRPPLPRTLGRLISLPFRKEREVIPTLARILLPARDFERAEELLASWPLALHEEAATTRAFFLQFAAVLRHSTGRRLAAIRCPTAVVTGDEDVLVPPKNSELLARKIPGATLHVLPGVGHDIPALDPDAVGRLLKTL